MSLQIVVVLSFTAIAALMIAVWMVVRDLAATRSGRSNALAIRPRAFWDQPLPTTITGKLDHAFDRLMWETGWELSPTTGFLVLLSSGLFIGGVAGFYFDNVFAGVLAGGAGMVAALVVFLIRRHRRMRQMANELPQLFDLMSRAVRAGRSIEQAVDFAAQEMVGPLGGEMQRCARHLEMGSGVTMAVQSLAKRVRLPELRMLASVMIVHRRSGGHLPVALERMSSVCRTRLNYRRQMQTSTAAARISAMVIAALAPLILLAFLVLKPDHVRVLFEHPMGQTLLTLAAVLQVVGLLWIARLIRAEED